MEDTDKKEKIDVKLEFSRVRQTILGMLTFISY